MIKHILVDMDGVLADFLSASLSLWDFDPKDYPANTWEIADVLGISMSDFWGTIDKVPTLWRDLKPYPWVGELIALLNDSGVPWSTLTTPSRNPLCAAQKIEWMREHIEPNFTNYMIGKQKYLMASPGHLLIDDYDKNVDSFREHGGQAILFPQRWNSAHRISDGWQFVATELRYRFHGDPNARGQAERKAVYDECLKDVRASEPERLP